MSKREELSDGAVKVWVYASAPDIDSDGEIITPEAVKAALPDYLKFGAVREMHGPNAAGATREAEIARLEALYKTPVEQLEKRAEEALIKLAEVQTEKEDLVKRVACLEALPEPPRVRLKAIAKAEDGEAFEPLVTPVRKADGSIDEVATEIKKYSA